MSYSLEDFARDCRAALAAEPGPAGRELARRHLERALADPAFVDDHLGRHATEPRSLLHEDADLGFCIFAHVYAGPKEAPPHDHAGSWAIYGQAEGVTEMTEWRRVKAPEGGKPGLVEPLKVYELRPGMAVVYNEADIHSPRRTAATRLIRIEGRNLEGVERDAYEPVAKRRAAE